MIILERSSRGCSLGTPAGKLVPTPANSYGVCLALLASGALLLGWSRHSIHQPLALLLFAGLAAVAGSQKLWLPASAKRRVSIGYIFVMAGLLLLGVPEAMLIAAASGLASSLLNVPEKPSLRAAVLNVSTLILSAALAGGALLVLGPTGARPPLSAGILPIFAAATLYFLTNSVLTAGAVALAEGCHVSMIWRQGLFWTAGGVFAGSSLAVLMALAYRLPDRTLFYLSLPLAYVLFAAYQATLERMDESRRHVEDLDRTARELYASFQRVGQALAAPLDTGTLYRLIVELSHEMLDPQMSGLCLWRDGALQLMAVRFATSFPTSRNGSVAEAVQRAAATALDQGQPTSTPANGVRAGATPALAFAVPLQSPGVVHGALCVIYDPVSRLTEARRQLLTGFATQAALALQNAHLFQSEQDAADMMRRSLLPPLYLDAPSLEIGAVYEPLIIDAGCIGGDYYDVFTLGDGRVAVSIADVCGKGISAAVRTALSKYTLRAYAVEAPSPRQVLARANSAFIAQESDPESFTTLAYVLLDPGGGRLTSASAGHPPLLLYRAVSGRCIELGAGGAVLGVMPGAPYEEEAQPFGPNDVLLLYTDGLLEARREDEQFGLERLEAAFMRVAARSAQEIAAALVEAGRDFAGGAFADDVTLLVLKNTCTGTAGVCR